MTPSQIFALSAIILGCTLVAFIGNLIRRGPWTQARGIIHLSLTVLFIIALLFLFSVAPAVLG